MHSRKSVGPRMEAWETPASTRYFCEDFLYRTTQSHLLLRKVNMRPNIWPIIPSDISLWRRPARQTLSKALGISRATARVAPDLLKAGNQKKDHISLDDQGSYYLQVFQRLY